MRKWLKDNRGFLLFLLCFGFVRTAVADWNPIPTGSMKPTILEGDVVFVNRLAFDAKVPLTDWSVARLGDPQRGDVVTFSSPKDGTRLIKRIVGLPGDVVQMRDEVLFVNGERAGYTDLAPATEILTGDVEVTAVRATEHLAGSRRSVQFLPPVGALRDFGPLKVPADHYFMLGDNRDNSEDSRFIGTVPRRLLIGRAHHILLSADITGHWLPRWERTGSAIR
ncbi:MAG TPA: signal peptidase I [Ideonella sp.]|uniref:signal peptidase I n=1 Tax=Ideonella sp. TaxID=1929293 RepID=UPI002E360C0E|nr:signal peptidase I [Ideonella sp.]HEX5687039.1 signal peptidase I [Ideonella sp.]